MTRNALKTWFFACLALGVIDLGAINFFLGPQAFPEMFGKAGPGAKGPGDSGQAGVRPSPETKTERPGQATRDEPTKVAAATTTKPGAGDEPATASKEPATASKEPATASKEPTQQPAIKPTPKPAPRLVERQIVVRFRTAKYRLDRANENQLASFVRAVRAEGRATRIVVEGHADSRGAEARNQQLSELRARNVVFFLRKRGVRSRRTVVKGLGDSQPELTGDTPEAWARNRRVVVRVEVQTGR